MQKAIIVAASEDGCIGKDGSLPWRFPEDLKWFKQTTLHHSVIMGRKTFESIGKPLPGRINVVLTRNPDSEILQEHKDKICIASSIHGAFQICSSNVMATAFIVGGAQVYEEALPFVQEIFLTKVKGSYEGDTFFPSWPLTDHGWVANIMLKESDNLQFWSYKRPL